MKNDTLSYRDVVGPRPFGTDVRAFYRARYGRNELSFSPLLSAVGVAKMQSAWMFFLKTLQGTSAFITNYASSGAHMYLRINPLIN